MGKPLKGIESVTCVISFTIHSLYLSGKDFVEFMSAMEIGRSFPERRLEKKSVYIFLQKRILIEVNNKFTQYLQAMRNM